MPYNYGARDRPGMTVIERCSLSSRSHPLVDSASVQSWRATMVPLTGIGADLIDADRDLDAQVHSRGREILDRDLVKHLIDFASPTNGTAPTATPVSGRRAFTSRTPGS
jgi:hypothetical protein